MALASPALSRLIEVEANPSFFALGRQGPTTKLGPFVHSNCFWRVEIEVWGLESGDVKKLRQLEEESRKLARGGRPDARPPCAEGNAFQEPLEPAGSGTPVRGELRGSGVRDAQTDCIGRKAWPCGFPHGAFILWVPAFFSLAGLRSL